MNIFRRFFSRHAHRAYARGMDAYNRGDHAGAADAFHEVLREAGEKSPVYVLSEFFVTQSLVHLGRAQLEAGDLDASERTLTEVAEKHPEFPDVQLMIGRIARARGHIEDAAAAWRRALATNPRYAEARFALGRLERSRGDLAAAAEHFRALADARPSGADGDTPLELPPAWLDGRPWPADAPESEEAAANRIERALGSPRASTAHVAEGVRAYHEGDLTGALAAFDRAVTSAPGHPDVRCRRATVLAELGRIADARRDLDEALQKNPAFAEARIKRGVLRFDAADYAGAERDFRALADVDPDNAELRLLLGLSLLRGGRIESARDELSVAHDDPTIRARAVVPLAEALCALDEPWTAREHLDAHESMEARCLLGRVHLHLGEPHRAIAVLEPLLYEPGAPPEAALALARAHQRVGDKGDAHAAAEVALGHASTHDEARLLTAELALDSGNHEDALSWLRGTSPERRHQYDAAVLEGRALTRAGRRDEARVVLERALEIGPSPIDAMRALAALNADGEPRGNAMPGAGDAFAPSAPSPLWPRGHSPRAA